MNGWVEKLHALREFAGHLSRQLQANSQRDLEHANYIVGTSLVAELAINICVVQ